MKVLSTYNFLLREKHKEITGEDAPVYFEDYGLGWFKELYAHARKHRITKSFRITKISFLKSDIPYFIWPEYSKKKRRVSNKAYKDYTKIGKYNSSSARPKQRVAVPISNDDSCGINDIFKLSNPGDQTGLYHIEFQEREKTYHLIYCCFLMGYKNDKQVLLCCSNELLNKIYKEHNKTLKRQEKPKLGFFDGVLNHNTGVLKYIKRTIPSKLKPTFHKVTKDITKDIDHFFTDISRIILQGEKGTKKILLAGEQGTGKSSFIIKLISNYVDKCSILNSTSLETLIKHQSLCSDHNVACICILEDCESYFGDNNATLLNALSGPLEPINTSGCYTIFTTNHPDRISDRIKHRPERIDDIFIISVLDKNDSLEVAEYYFSKFLPKKFDYLKSGMNFEGHTGAEIMQITQLVKKYADYKNIPYDQINNDFIQKCINTNNNKYKKLQKINTAETKLAKIAVNYEAVGFNRHEETEEEEF